MKPGEQKTVQARILKYAVEIGWTVVPGEEAEKQRDFYPVAGAGKLDGLVPQGFILLEGAFPAGHNNYRDG